MLGRGLETCDDGGSRLVPDVDCVSAGAAAVVVVVDDVDIDDDDTATLPAAATTPLVGVDGTPLAAVTRFELLSVRSNFF
jgi:hypothetical protein